MLQEAMTKENFERMEQGLRPVKPKVEPRPEPKKPIVDNEVKLSQIPDGYTVKLEQAFRKSVRNENKVLFIGYEVLIELIPEPREKGPGRPPEPKTIMGWMIEGEFLALLRKYSKQIDRQVIRW